jgi:Predicted membrane protein
MNRLRIRKLGVLSVAKIEALVLLVVSLLISIPYGLIIILYSLFGAGMIGGNGGLALGGGGVVLGIGIMIGLPIMYGIMGFIGGAIGALVYNLFAGIVGGIEIEVENVI